MEHKILTWISDDALTCSAYKGGDIVSICFFYMFIEHCEALKITICVNLNNFEFWIIDDKSCVTLAQKTSIVDGWLMGHKWIHFAIGHIELLPWVQTSLS